MKRLIVLAALASALCAPAAFAQGDRTDSINRPTNLYITSMYRVRVYLNNRVVDVLRPGQRTKIIKSKGGFPRSSHHGRAVTAPAGAADAPAAPTPQSTPRTAGTSAPPPETSKPRPAASGTRSRRE